MNLSMWCRIYSRKFIQFIRLIPYLQQSKLFISILILLVLGLHALPVLQGLIGRKQTFWPFMSWSMYRGSYNSEHLVQTATHRTIAITATGQEWKIESAFTEPKGFFHVFPTRDEDDSNSIGVRYFAFARFYLEPMWEGDSSAAQGLAERLNRGREVPIVQIRLERANYIVTDSGIIKELTSVISYSMVD